MKADCWLRVRPGTDAAIALAIAGVMIDEGWFDAEFVRDWDWSGHRAAVCVISTPDRAPMWGILANVLSRFLPEQRNIIYLSFALADPNRLEGMLADAGFRDIRIEREKREDVVESFDDYWNPIEAGIGSMPQAYLALSKEHRRSVRVEVRDRLSQFESNGRLRMSIEMLIARGRA